MTSSFSVSKMSPELVVPSEPTPSSGHLPLSIADDVPIFMHYVQLILVFKSTYEGRKEEHAAKVIREGLAKALVPYYPVAGRIVVDPDNADRLLVAPTGEGVPFVAASANCTLRDVVDYVQKHPLMMNNPKEQLLPQEITTTVVDDLLIAGDGIPSLKVVLHPVPFMVQVTQFNCGGFTVGIKFNHTMFDGMGAGQFMTAMDEMARGLGEPTIKPVWCRESIPGRVDRTEDSSVVHITKPPPPTIGDHIKLEHYVFDLPLDYIDQLRNDDQLFMGEIRCTTFEIATAKLWQCRTRAIDLQPDDAVTLAFPVNFRRQLINDNILPSGGIGYYGNCVYRAEIESSSEQIASGSLFDIAKLIRRGKESVLGKYRRMLGKCEVLPPKLPSYEGLFVVDWRRLGFSDTDYGWGTADYVVPLLDEHQYNFGNAYLVNSPPPMKKGIRIIMHSVTKEHFEDFRNGMNYFS